MLDRWLVSCAVAVVIIVIAISYMDDARQTKAREAEQALREAEQQQEKRKQDHEEAVRIAEERKNDPYYDERGPCPYIMSNGLMDVASQWVRENTTDGTVVSATPPDKYSDMWAQFGRIKARNPFGVFVIRRFEFRVKKGQLVHAGYDD